MIPLDGTSGVGTAGVIPPSAAPGDFLPGGQASTATSLRARQAATSVAVGTEQQLNVLLTDQAGLVPTSGVIWLSSNSSVATVNPNGGQVKGVSVGTAVITASLQANPAAQAQITVTVSETLNVTGITVTPQSAKLERGDSVTLQASVKMADGTINANVAWQSSDESIATVDDQGRVKGQRDGQVTIEAAYAPEPRFKGIAVITVGDFKPSPAPTTNSDEAPGTTTTPGETGTPVVAAPAVGKVVRQSIDLSRSFGGLNSVSFVDAKNGYVQGNSESATLYATTDGGVTWTQVESTAFQSVSGQTIHFQAPGIGTLKAGAFALHTTDGGVTWTSTDLLALGGYSEGMRFDDADHGYVPMYSRDGQFISSVLVTDDGGATWQVNASPGPAQTLGFHRVAGTTIAMGADGLYDASGTRTQELAIGGYASNASGYDIAARGSDITFVSSFNGSVFLTSSNQGKSWKNMGPIKSAAGDSLMGRFYTDIEWFGDTGFYKTGNLFAVTSDAGKTWVELIGPRSDGNSEDLVGMSCVSAKAAWIVSKSGKIFRYVGP